jgi:hypothetical protein
MRHTQFCALLPFLTTKKPFVLKGSGGLALLMMVRSQGSKSGQVHPSALSHSIWATSLPYSHDSAVGIAFGFGLKDRGVEVRVPVGSGFFSVLPVVQAGCLAHPASYSIGIGISFFEVKQSECEADHSPPTGTDFSKTCSIHSLLITC